MKNIENVQNAIRKNLKENDRTTLDALVTALTAYQMILNALNCEENAKKLQSYLEENYPPYEKEAACYSLSKTMELCECIFKAVNEPEVKNET